VVIQLMNTPIMGTLLCFYIVRLYKTDAVPKPKRLRWLLLLLIGNVFAMPFFYYHYFLRPPSMNDEAP
jgi:hypothetical protein